jgi:hypothetical protein
VCGIYGLFEKAANWTWEAVQNDLHLLFHPHLLFRLHLGIYGSPTIGTTVSSSELSTCPALVAKTDQIQYDEVRVKLYLPLLAEVVSSSIVL